MLTLILFFSALLLGMPIFLALLLAALTLMYQLDYTILMSSTTIQMFGSLNQSGLLAIPLFMLVGELMNKGGLTKKLMATADIFVGGFKGGLAYVNLLTNAMAASILGSATAQISVMSQLMIPTMTEKGYSKPFSAAVTIAGGLLGPIIPPSMLMIIYGVVAYQPISALFIAGILPGMLIILSFALVIILTGWIKGLPAGEHMKHKNIRVDLIAGILPGLIPVSVIIFIVTGVMTPTEAGAIAAILSFLISTCVYRTLSWTDLPAMFGAVAQNTAMITGLIAAASLLGWTLTFDGIPEQMVAFIVSLTDSKIVFLILVYLLVILLGIFLESISVMIVIVPIILPAAITYGIDPIHFGVIISLATLIGLVTPPVGPGLYIAMAATQMNMGALFRAVIPFLLAMMVCMMLIAFFPALSLWLPSLM
ncbi:TRAP transporter large permease [Vibrio cincinnatiensis]|uniref:TRAP transporter large permease n=1 Tax=Vibrio cincinnatiensis TaxID=675 RepID=UPI001FA99C93|nr:TRAP transporter large permease [Vibrio cincinnatiensis]